MEGHESKSPISVSREASLDRATQSSGPDTLDGGSPMPSRPPSPLQNHDKIDKIDLTVIEILDHISSVAFTGQRLNGAGLTREEARACQEGFVRYMNWQGLRIEREIHPLTLEEGTAEINHYHQEIHGNYMPFRIPMGLCESPSTYMTLCQSLLTTSSSERSERGSPQDKNNSASTQQMYTSPQRRRHQYAYRRSPDGDPDPSDSEWDSVSTASEISSVNRRQRGEGTYDPKMDRKIFLPKLTDDSSKEACWMWRADALDLIEKGCPEKAIEV